MTDIFISYSRVDRPRIELLAAALKAEGFDVWWDRNLTAGSNFTAETEQRLNEAKIVLVAWSTTSVGSMWVADEASIGREKGNLIPIAIDEAPPPLGFRQIQTLPFDEWTGDRAAPEFIELTAALQAAAKRAPATGKPITPEERAPDRSIAVLPFANMSPDPEQAYFSDGVAEEIIVALMKVDGLKVVGRTSSFSFKGKDTSLRDIGSALGVAYVLDGSVRKAGDRVRISVQLVSARDGFQIWSHSYDRKHGDIFDVQDEIARAVVGELKIKLAAPPARFVAADTSKDEAYQLFLQGRYVLRQRYGENGGSALLRAVDFFKRAIAIDPGFARAYSNLSLAYTWMPQYVDADMDEAFEKSKACAAEATRLDPTLGEHHAGLAVLHLYTREYALSLASAERAGALAPQDATVMRVWGNVMLLFGYREAAQVHLADALRIDPTSGMEAAWAGEGAFMLGDYERARKLSHVAFDLGCTFAGRVLAELAARDGDFQAAGAYYTQAMKAADKFDGVDSEMLAALAFGDAAAKTKASAMIDIALTGDQGHRKTEFLIVMLMKVGRFDEAFDLFLANRTTHEDAILAELWNPDNAPLRESPAFARFAQSLGFIELWNAKGWPSLIPESLKTL
ncbi:MAG: TIR domain-containing protein [Parvularculaceae bacterium]|nr:TIR domain-containing protein [Parvularculaceae bacterium]